LTFGEMTGMFDTRETDWEHIEECDGYNYRFAVAVAVTAMIPADHLQRLLTAGPAAMRVRHCNIIFGGTGYGKGIYH